jgi:hypothetical protein
MHRNNNIANQVFENTFPKPPKPKKGSFYSSFETSKTELSEEFKKIFVSDLPYSIRTLKR